MQPGGSGETEDEHEAPEPGVRGREAGVHGPAAEDERSAAAALRTEPTARFQTATGTLPHVALL